MHCQRRDVSSEEAALVCDGRLLPARTAATGNARSPRVDRRVDVTAPASSRSRQSAYGDEQQRLMSAVDCQPGTPVLYRAHSGMPEHRTGTGFAAERVTGAAAEAVKSCAVGCLRVM